MTTAELLEMFPPGAEYCSDDLADMTNGFVPRKACSMYLLRAYRQRLLTRRKLRRALGESEVWFYCSTERGVRRLNYLRGMSKKQAFYSPDGAVWPLELLT